MQSYSEWIFVQKCKIIFQYMLTSKISKLIYGFEVHWLFEYKQDYFVFVEMGSLF